VFRSRSLTAAGFGLAVTFAAAGALAQTAATPASTGDTPPTFSKDMFSDKARIAAGEAIWKDQCSHCHGAKAYPGKAPKLKPLTYTPEFVWDRVHNGFRGMPPWKDVYKPDEIVNVVVWIMSDDFWP
jgi:mono/diheme cytochrome c family protein